MSFVLRACFIRQKQGKGAYHKEKLYTFSPLVYQMSKNSWIFVIATVPRVHCHYSQNGYAPQGVNVF